MSRRQSSAKPEGLSQLNLNAAGIDVGATSHFVAVPADRAEPPVREFEAFTAGLHVPNCELFAGRSIYKESSMVEVFTGS